jgi:diaminobutyrate-2-oxoglutarate transaminase
MWGIELVDEPGSPVGEFAGRVQGQALREGLIIELGGRDDVVVRLLPPLNVTAEVVDMACTILIDVIERCAPATDRVLKLVPVQARARD